MNVDFEYVSQHLDGSADCEFLQPAHTIMVYRGGRVLAKEYDVESMGTRRVETPQAGSVWILPAEHRGAALARGNTVADYCQLTVPTAALGAYPLAPAVGRDHLLFQLVQRMYGLRDRSDVGARLLQDSLNETVRLHLRDRYIPAAAVDVEQAPKTLSANMQSLLREYLEDSLDVHISLRELADIARMPINRFAAAFNEAFHTTPHQYVIDQRISRAKHLLATSTLSVTEITTAIGFSTPSHFATTFKSRVGLTPSQYRRHAQ
ncbi:AraC family transcriptional regulator [Mycolicibacterium septicum]|uniref:AraC family transcriptional regulator n=1 Tax=Mycolicibacterium septicum TaxID=98668 RepID=UPI0023E25096|nr:AraC family transcriptional regulator [Mycolicibacterium septicum]MDF3336897.1 AraC family transcriptional regulator [Mycolicibacterium septicum]